MSATPRWSGDRSGATLAMVAVFMLVLLAVASLAVDMAMGFASRAEAQRIADSAALAGASAYLDMDADEAEDSVRARAYQYALRHTIRGDGVDSAEVTVQVLTDSMKVRVWVNREGLSTWFARIFGVDEIDVGAMAAAQALEGGSASCVKPFALPDLWDDPDDTDGDDVWDPTEEWEWGDDGGEYYERFEQGTPNSLTGTGYGTLARDYLETGYDRDQGREITIKPSDPNDPYAIQPGVFFPIRMPISEGQEECDKGPSPNEGQTPGASVYRNNICSCNTNLIELGDSVEIQTGNMIGPTQQGLKELIEEDEYAEWVDNGDGTGYVSSPDYGNGLASPRVVTIALMDPTQIIDPGMQKVVFNNYALFFIEDQGRGQQQPVTGRFIKFASAAGPGNGSLVLYIQLVE